MDPHDGNEDGEFAECLEAARALLSGNEDTSDLWEANDLVNRALACAPQSTDGWLVKSQILSALRAAPDDEWLIEDLFYEKGVILATMGRPEAAITTFQAGLLRCPESALLKAGLEPLPRERRRAPPPPGPPPPPLQGHPRRPRLTPQVGGSQPPARSIDRPRSRRSSLAMVSCWISLGPPPMVHSLM